MMNELTKTQLLLQQIAAVLMLIGAAGFMLLPLAGTVVFTVGALVFVPLQMLQRYEGKNFVNPRWHSPVVYRLLHDHAGGALRLCHQERVGRVPHRSLYSGTLYRFPHPC